MPHPPQPGEPSRDLPAEIIAQLCGHLDKLEVISSRRMRTAVELLIDTGRRPEEICTLGFGCLDRDSDGAPVLVYDNHKAARLGRRLPVSQATARLITDQQAWTRARFPHTPAAELKLLPTSFANPGGRKGIRTESLSERHRTWVDALPPLLRADGSEYDKAKITLYAYRHTYAQRHADAGVPADVLRELMDHRLLDATRQYYRVGETRRRQAVDRVAVMQFDRHGNRTWQQAKALLDSEHVRRAVGEVAVPFGVCAEPSNVKAGGQACPFRFRCAGCDHFRTDVSYLPDLQAYLDDLLRSKERLLAASRTGRVGEGRRAALGRGDHPDPAAHHPDQRRPWRVDRRRTRPDRSGHRRRPPPPRRHARHAPHPPGPSLPPPRAHRMTTGSTRAKALADGRRADSARRRQRVIAAINRAATDGTEISVSAIARAAAVDRTFLYRHRDLLGQIHATQAGPPGAGTGPAVTRASLQADLLAAHQRALRLTARIQQLETRLSEALGDQAWRESGLGAPADIDALNHKIANLDQQVTGLRLQLEERDSELAAARAANRELMARLNATARR